ncbi:DUF6090 family protein [Rhodohalobacter mucosus]|uniref:Uncharacterized protein n=1 Tax=Rhodohalobacter mucosus TaxID=2079485 RepID=A0A316TR41_9BACT|nr:DUF6090 family protein [Rhodohalobacter mucosus]PWN05495.1 hypothetical protein DDZ15_12875 [Rhodohalobacter mucosus]
MEQNKVRTYLLYAIGEILLVVIGILIALQVNNWNEERKEEAIAMEVRSSIVKDLHSDIASIDTFITRIKREIEIYDSLQLQLIDPEVTEDEVIRLIKDEFSPFHLNFEGFNDNSYRTALSSGNINFLSEAQRTILYQLATKQSDILRTNQNYEQLYLDAISEFNKSYPLQIPFATFKSGPVFDRKWIDPDFDDLTSKFNNVGTGKRNYYRITLQDMNEVNELNRQTVAMLEDKP